MPLDSEIEVGPLRPDVLADVVAIHRAEIAYSLNSKLGAEHLARLYGVIQQDADSAIAVAYRASDPVGVVVATLDPSRLMRRLMADLRPAQWLQLALRAGAAPSAIFEWL